MALKTLTDQASKDPFGHAVGLPKSGVVLASGDFKAADPAPIEVTTPYGANNVTLIISITVQSGAGNTLTVTVERWDEAKQGWVAMLVSAGLVAVADTELRIGTNIAASANVAANTVLPMVFRVKPVKSGTTTTLNYSIGAHFTA